MSDIPSGMDKVITSVLRQTGYGSDESAIADLLRGANTSSVGKIIQADLENQGWTFFTKPCINLHPGNINGIRKLEYLSDENPRSIGRALKALLTTRKYNLANGDVSVPSELVDEEQAFNYLLSGTLKSLNGFPDHVATFFSSEEGSAKESYGWVDSRYGINNEFSLNATLWNIDGDLVSLYLAALFQYQSEVAYGRLIPSAAILASNIIDYQFRVYRIIVDKNKEKILKIAATGPCAIESPADGAAFNFNAESIMSADNTEISIPIKCYGVSYNDPKIIDDFNRTVTFNNPSMNEKALTKGRKSTRRAFEVSEESGMVKIHIEEYKLCSTYLFPFIQDNTGDAKMEWWIRAEELNSLLNI